MKNAILLLLVALTLNEANAQVKPGVVKKTTVVPGPVLKNLNDSASYAIGISVANAYKQHGINNINTTLVSRAINDYLGGKKCLLDQGTATQVISNYTNTPPAQRPAARPVPAKPGVILKNLADSVSYSIGINVADFYKQFGVSQLNTSCVSKSINEVMTGRKVLFNDTSLNGVMNAYLTELQFEKSKPIIAAGEKFLAENKLRPGVKTTPSGLQYEVVTEGTGINPTAADSVTCNYKGTLIDGTEFDNSYKRGTPVTFSLGRVIAGWTEGLQLMKPGAKYKFYIPYQLGYGVYDHAPIPGGSALLFEVDLLEVRKQP